MTQPAEPEKGSRFVWLLFLTPVLYILSTGPVIFLFEHSGKPGSWEPILEIVYYPIEWLWDNSEVARKILEVYLDLFR